MFLLDSLQEILFTLRQNKLRTILTAFGVFWGIFMLIMLLGAGRGLQNGAESGFTSNVRDSVWLWTGKTSIPYQGLPINRQVRYTEDDIEAIRREIPGVKIVSGENPLGSVNGGDTLITYGKRSGNFGVFGVADDYFSIKANLDFHAGRPLNAMDNAESRKVAMIGTLVRDRLFPGENPVGQFVRINGISFRIVGLFYDEERQGQASERLYVPFSVYQKTFGKGENYVRIITYQPKPGYDPFEVEQEVVALLQQRHNVAPEDRRGIRSNNFVEASQATEALFAAINAFIWFVGIGTLMAGIVGISNIMMITVKERTVEIGVRKALGARPRQIVAALLFESILVTALAGYAGLVCGVGLLELIQFIMRSLHIQNDFFERPEVDLALAVQAIAILVIAGALAGFAPAWRAANISPVEAMRE